MKIKATKTFARYVNNLVKTLGIAESAEFKLVGPMDYPGGTICNPDSDVDYDNTTDRYRVIKVYYKYEDYACPCTISTPMLMEICDRLGEQISIEELNEELKNLIEI